jgi:filamentous hemagglutinin
VNRSRVLTFAGGDGIIWSTLGDIDAGRGAKTTRAPTAPNVITDADANTKIFERADVSGSGIGTVAGFSGVEEGDFDLNAPGGSVNAGDAGIRVSGNFNIVTPVFFNADNLDVTGKSKGVAVVTAPNLGGLTEAGNVAGASAHQVVSPAQNQANGQPSVIIVEFLGYGGGGDGDDTGNKEDQRRGAPGRQGYNIESPVQVIGNGELTSLQKSQLTEREKENYGDGR